MNKLAVITGANSGIGKSIAEKLESEGYKLLLISLHDQNIKEHFGKNENALIKLVDVSNYVEFENAVREAEDKFGPVNVMINNAGMMNLEKADIQDFKTIAKQNEININGVMFGTQIALKSMKKEKEGTIINVSSIAGIKSFPNHSAYNGTKYAVRGYTETVRSEVSQEGIRVSLISPGVVKTNLLSTTDNKEIKKDYENWRDSSNAYVLAEDIANIASFIINQPKYSTIREIVVGPTTQVE